MNALCGRDEVYRSFFNYNHRNGSVLETIFQDINHKKHLRIKQYAKNFNTIIGPNLYFNLKEERKVNLGKLLDLIDKKYQNEFMQNANIQDTVRIKSLAVPGASSWIKALQNSIFGEEYDDNEYWFLSG